MHALIDRIATAVTVTPSPEQTVDPVLVTPGPWGFVAIAFLTLAVIALIWDMLRRIRRGRYRAEVNEELDAEEQAERAELATDADSQDIDETLSAEGDTDADTPRR
ncbi:hypothetical protein CVS47_01945 [Microbacterium lemovicicum]|uniref:Uncharacterized protein n=1 Tax=Microbacterium lemovicicum TaxID=1072463 RepID=A0A3S9WB61_9MICO|nr:hypothetical protein [Microbacterium lemovicicum]AZS37311.1 hypothetical protein CVS47_01945 [Microbacterium lemovicicum]